MYDNMKLELRVILVCVIWLVIWSVTSKVDGFANAQEADPPPSPNPGGYAIFIPGSLNNNRLDQPPVDPQIDFYGRLGGATETFVHVLEIHCHPLVPDECVFVYDSANSGSARLNSRGEFEFTYIRWLFSLTGAEGAMLMQGDPFGETCLLYPNNIVWDIPGDFGNMDARTGVPCYPNRDNSQLIIRR